MEKADIETSLGRMGAQLMAPFNLLNTMERSDIVRGVSGSVRNQVSMMPRGASFSDSYDV